MARTKIDAHVADGMMGAVEEFTKLEAAMNHLRYGICFDHTGNGARIDEAKRRCRRLIERLQMVEHSLNQSDKTEASALQVVGKS